MNPKVILVKNGGTLEIHGKRKLPWTKISRTLEPSSSGQIYFEHKVRICTSVHYIFKNILEENILIQYFSYLGKCVFKNSSALAVFKILIQICHEKCFVFMFQNHEMNKILLVKHVQNFIIQIYHDIVNLSNLWCGKIGINIYIFNQHFFV